MNSLITCSYSLPYAGCRVTLNQFLFELNACFRKPSTYVWKHFCWLRPHYRLPKFFHWLSSLFSVTSKNKCIICLIQKIYPISFFVSLNCPVFSCFESGLCCRAFSMSGLCSLCRWKYGHLFLTENGGASLELSQHKPNFSILDCSLGF